MVNIAIQIYKQNWHYCPQNKKRLGQRKQKSSEIQIFESFSCNNLKYLGFTFNSIET